MPIVVSRGTPISVSEPLVTAGVWMMNVLTITRMASVPIAGGDPRQARDRHPEDHRQDRGQRPSGEHRLEEPELGREVSTR